MVHLKIADFGLSSILNNSPRSVLKESFGPRGTANYLAPEVCFVFFFLFFFLFFVKCKTKVLAGNQLSTAADVFSYGVLLWQLLTRRKPYEDLGSVSIDGFTDLIVDEEVRPELDGDTCRDYPIVTDLIERCWRAEMHDRPDFSEICDIMTDALVEIAIPHDAEAQSFWHKFFPSAGPEGVKIERLVKALLKWFRMPTNPEMRSSALQKQLSLLELLLVEREDLGTDLHITGAGKQRVTAEWFGHIVSWLGPFDTDMLKRVASLCSKPWFHGHLSSAQVFIFLVPLIPFDLSTKTKGYSFVGRSQRRLLFGALFFH
jgi:serine/threonine protein kinase